MGTRADFYVGVGPKARWIGSISFDGYPEGWPEKALRCRLERTFRAAVEKIKSKDGLFTSPSEGWPWPWEDSRTTDFAYAFVGRRGKGGRVLVSCFGSRWETLAEFRARGGDDDEPPRLRDDEVVDMSARMMPLAGIMAKSGLLVLTSQ